MTTPRHLHRVLVWGYDPGAEAEGWWERFRELHPGWTLRTWTDPVDPAAFELGRLFESCSSGAQLADLLRIEILWRHGGVYVDSDVEPLASLEPLTELDFFIGTEDGRVISSGVIGAAPGHPALRDLMDRLLEHPSLPPDLSTRLVTGPLLYTRAFERRADITVLPREVFYPYNPYIGIERSGDWSDRHAICVHHWAASWDTTAPEPKSPNLGDLMRRSRSMLGRARSRIRPFSRRVATYLVPTTACTHAVYVGANRVLVDTSDGFRLHAVADDEGLTPELAGRGWSDDALLTLLDDLLRPGDWYVDVGAGIGLFALAAARRVGRWGGVVAIEADHHLAELCKSNARMNDYRNVQVIAAAADAQTSDHDVLNSLPRLDDHIPAAAPIRLARLNVGGRATDVLSGMTQLLAGGLVDFIVVNTLAGVAGQQRQDLLEHLAKLVNDHGARLRGLNGKGQMEAITLTEVRLLAIERQLIIDLTEVRPKSTEGGPLAALGKRRPG